MLARASVAQLLVATQSVRAAVAAKRKNVFIGIPFI
jgi:hypothetical protein